MCAGTEATRLSGLGVWWVSRSVALFNCCRSTVRRGSPFFFGVTTIREHQVVPVPCGTHSMMPSRTSRSRSSFTLLFQWWGTGIGVCTACGIVPGLKVTRAGDPVMRGRGCCVHVLNALVENAVSSQFFKFSTFSAVGLVGSCLGLSGVPVRRGHEHK